MPETAAKRPAPRHPVPEVARERAQRWLARLLRSRRIDGDKK
jgi:hypothetical protein